MARDQEYRIITRYLQRIHLFFLFCPFCNVIIARLERFARHCSHRMGIYASKKEAAIKIFRHRCARGGGEAGGEGRGGRWIRGGQRSELKST